MCIVSILRSWNNETQRNLKNLKVLTDWPHITFIYIHTTYIYIYMNLLLNGYMKVFTTSFPKKRPVFPGLPVRLLHHLHSISVTRYSVELPQCHFRCAPENFTKKLQVLQMEESRNPKEVYFTALLEEGFPGTHKLYPSTPWIGGRLKMVIHCLVLIIPGRNRYVVNSHGDRRCSQIPGVTGPLPNCIYMAALKLLSGVTLQERKGLMANRKIKLRHMCHWRNPNSLLLCLDVFCLHVFEIWCCFKDSARVTQKQFATAFWSGGWSGRFRRRRLFAPPNFAWAARLGLKRMFVTSIPKVACGGEQHASGGRGSATNVWRGLLPWEFGRAETRGTWQGTSNGRDIQ